MFMKKSRAKVPSTRPRPTPEVTPDHGARLGVNLDHIATIRQLRGTPYPSVLEAARLVQTAGADQITVHLREDRRHIQDADVRDLRAKSRLPLNLEMAATEAMTRFALKVHPDWVCLVPEKRAEVTTEGGLDVRSARARLARVTHRLKAAGILVSLFIEPEVEAVRLSAEVGADAVELHTGAYCLATQSRGGAAKTARQCARIEKAAREAVRLGLGAHAGHGFDFENVRAVAALERDAPARAPLIEEFNIGHAIIARAALVGLERAVREMIASIRAP
jgi:pyridoxine 5-phosphate synthase